MHISSILRRLLMVLGVMPACAFGDDGGGAVLDDPEEDVIDGDNAATETTDEAADETTDDDTGEVIVSIGDPAEADPQQEEQARAPDWVRDLRKSNRELVRKQRQLEEENARLKGGGPATQPVQLGPKPTLAGSDYDEEKFAQALDAWHDRKRQIDDQQAEKERAEQTQRQAWQAKLDAYGRAKAALKVRDFEDVEAAAQDVLSTTQQGIVLDGAENPALVVYALGSNPKKAKELAAITSPVKFAFAVAKLETQLKLTPKKSAPPPERTVRGSSGIVAGGTDATLARLQAQADKTGDRTPVAAYMRAQKAKAR